MAHKGIYKNKVKKISENNKLLALALQNDRSQKEELLAESRANADLVLFSRLKLATMSENLKKAVSVLDEALSLLEMHSSNSILKFSPKSTTFREEFKEQVRGVTMAAISEEIEPPGKKSTQKNLTENGSLKKADDVHHSFPQENLNNIEQNMCGNKPINENFKQVDVREEIVSPVKKCVEFSDCAIPGNSNFPLRKKQKKNTSNRKRTQKDRQKAFKISNKENLSKNFNKNSETLQFDLIKANIYSEAGAEKINCVDNSTEKIILAKIDLSLNSDQSNQCAIIPQKKENEKNLKGKISSKSSKSNEEKTTELHNAIDNSSIQNFRFKESLQSNTKEKLVFSITKENPSSKNFRNSKLRKTALTNISEETKESPSNKDLRNSKVKKAALTNISEETKENPSNKDLRNSKVRKTALTNTFEETKENPSNKDLRNSKVRKTALTNISSKINIENLTLEKNKRKAAYSLDSASTLIEMDENEIKKMKPACPLDDLTFTGTKEKDFAKKKTNKFLKNIKKSFSGVKMNENISPLSETSKSSTDLILQPEAARLEKGEMVKNLAKNTFLVSAEVHKIPPAVLKILPKTVTLQPVVLLHDILKASKSLCKSISSLPINQANEISLEKQLFEHCSSLKIIAEDSLHTPNKGSVNTDSSAGKSVYQDKEENSKRILNIEPPLLVDGEAKEVLVNEDKKSLRKRQLQLNYREPLVNTKLRREQL